MNFSRAASLLAISALLRVETVAAFAPSSRSARAFHSVATATTTVSRSNKNVVVAPPTLRFMGDDASETKSLDDITTELAELKKAFDEKLAAVKDEAGAEEIQRDYLGKKGSISPFMGYMRVLADDEKPKLGAAVSELKSAVEEAMNEHMTGLGMADFMEKSKAKSEKKPKQKKKQQAPAPVLEVDVSNLDIRVGVITKAWEHEEADKLFCEEIDVGEAEPRQIASGLRAHYTLDQMEGQRVLVLANLKSRKLMGFPSHGMVMCASNDDDGKVEFVEPPADAAIGERVMVEGFDGEPATENQVIKKKLLDAIFPDLRTNDEGVATYKGKPLTTSVGPCKAQNGMANAEVA